MQEPTEGDGGEQQNADEAAIHVDSDGRQREMFDRDRRGVAESLLSHDELEPRWMGASVVRRAGFPTVVRRGGQTEVLDEAGVHECGRDRSTADDLDS